MSVSKAKYVTNCDTREAGEKKARIKQAVIMTLILAFCFVLEWQEVISKRGLEIKLKASNISTLTNGVCCHTARVGQPFLVPISGVLKTLHEEVSEDRMKVATGR